MSDDLVALARIRHQQHMRYLHQQRLQKSLHPHLKFQRSLQEQRQHLRQRLHRLSHPISAHYYTIMHMPGSSTQLPSML